MKKIVEKFSKKIKTSFFYYVLGLILNKEKKTCTNIARCFGVSHDFLYRFLSRTNLLIPLFPKLMISMVKYFSQEQIGWLVIDDSRIRKLIL